MPTNTVSVTNEQLYSLGQLPQDFEEGEHITTIAQDTEFKSIEVTISGVTHRIMRDGFTVELPVAAT